ncbi:hypothetical protein [Echinimonas agarilytica]|uniref:Uncharacterized protein n=1 Tax=Echinimonas agarilytica TaxID=1215918 RepID=A0AA42B603_9GAMM|nr:hypothetical protein [Echinimonas agarilytica]MCM2678247.1 hypothetical protein [Echinimonas agarilytica]
MSDNLYHSSEFQQQVLVVSQSPTDFSPEQLSQYSANQVVAIELGVYQALQKLRRKANELTLLEQAWATSWSSYPISSDALDIASAAARLLSDYEDNIPQYTLAQWLSSAENRAHLMFVLQRIDRQAQCDWAREFHLRPDLKAKAPAELLVDVALNCRDSKLMMAAIDRGEYDVVADAFGRVIVEFDSQDSLTLLSHAAQTPVLTVIVMPILGQTYGFMPEVQQLMMDSLHNDRLAPSGASALARFGTQQTLARVLQKVDRGELNENAAQFARLAVQRSPYTPEQLLALNRAEP